MLLSETTFFVDRCLGVHAGLKLREAGLRVELHKDHFEDDTEDEIWLPAVAERGWVVLTKDRGLRRKEVERNAIRLSKARVFTLSRGNFTSEDMAAIFLQNGLGMARFMRKNPAPFIANVSRSGITSLDVKGLEG